MVKINSTKKLDFFKLSLSCAKHFYESDLITKSTNKRHKKSHLPHQRSLARICLKNNAVPSVFPTLPKYLTSLPSPNQRAGKSTACAKLEKENAQIVKLNEQISNQDYFTTFHEFNEKLRNTVLPKGFVTAHEESSTCFHYFQYNDGKNIAPTSLVSVIVNEHLHIKVFVSSVFIPQTKYGYLITSEKIQFISKISNILAWCKAHAEL